jgi:hypothetical protein
MPTQKCAWVELENGKEVHCPANAMVHKVFRVCKIHRDVEISPEQHRSKDLAAYQQATKDDMSSKMKREKTKREDEVPEARTARLKYMRDWNAGETANGIRRDLRRNESVDYKEQQAISKNAQLEEEAVSLGVSVESLREEPTLRTAQAEAIVADFLNKPVRDFDVDRLDRKFLFAHLHRPLLEMLTNDFTAFYTGINGTLAKKQQPTMCEASIADGQEGIVVGDADDQVSRLAWMAVATRCRVAGAVDRRYSSQRCRGESRSTTGSATVKEPLF